MFGSEVVNLRNKIYCRPKIGKLDEKPIESDNVAL